jgi:hypothetical protein
MTRDQIKTVVKGKMDELDPLGTGTTIEDSQIEAQLDHAAITLLESLPSVLAIPEEAFVTAENLITDLSIDIPCPTDFLRLHKLKLTDHVRMITDLLPPNHPAIDLQVYKHVRASIYKPIGVLTKKTTGHVITVYPPPTDTLYAIEEFLYVKRPTAAEDLDDTLIDMLAWTCASAIYTIAGSPLAKTCQEALTQIVQAKMTKYNS